MIESIGVICEDVISSGFLRGLCDRLGCRARLVPSPATIGRTTHLNRKKAREAWDHFLSQGVDLVVRFVDADRQSWQAVKERERGVFPEKARSLIVLGVATENVEDWLCIDAKYLSDALGIDVQHVPVAVERTSLIKNGISTAAALKGRKKSDVVYDLVVDCPQAVFRQWLKSNSSLRAFYQECRSVAQQHDCDTRNELDRS